MLSFKKLTLADKSIIQQFTLINKRRSCDLSFANLYSWNFLYQTEFAVAANALFLRFYIANEQMYMLPVTDELSTEVLDLLLEDATKSGCPLIIGGVCADTIAIIEAWMPGRFTFTAERDYADYIYLADDLRTLTGKRYQPKRNHINQFKAQHPDYIYQPLSAANVTECLYLEEKWCDTHDLSHSKALSAERHSMTRALSHLSELDIQGGLLLLNNRIIAFTYGAPINQEVFDICVEKADTTVEGAYAMINHEFALRLPIQYRYLNREEDLGIDGLRRAKLSYHPLLLLEKYTARML